MVAPGELERGNVVRFNYEGDTYEGTVLSAGKHRVHIQSGNRGVYRAYSEIIRVLPVKNEIPRLGERLRFRGGLE